MKRIGSYVNEQTRQKRQQYKRLINIVDRIKNNIYFDESQITANHLEAYDELISKIIAIKKDNYADAKERREIYHKLLDVVDVIFNSDESFDENEVTESQLQLYDDLIMKIVQFKQQRDSEISDLINSRQHLDQLIRLVSRCDIEQFLESQYLNSLNSKMEVYFKRILNHLQKIPLYLRANQEYDTENQEEETRENHEDLQFLEDQGGKQEEDQRGKQEEDQGGQEQEEQIQFNDIFNEIHHPQRQQTMTKERKSTLNQIGSLLVGQLKNINQSTKSSQDLNKIISEKDQEIRLLNNRLKDFQEAYFQEENAKYQKMLELKQLEHQQLKIKMYQLEQMAEKITEDFHKKNISQESIIKKYQGQLLQKANNENNYKKQIEMQKSIIVLKSEQFRRMTAEYQQKNKGKKMQKQNCKIEHDLKVLLAQCEKLNEMQKKELQLKEEFYLKKQKQSFEKIEEYKSRLKGNEKNQFFEDSSVLFENNAENATINQQNRQEIVDIIKQSLESTIQNKISQAHLLYRADISNKTNMANSFDYRSNILILMKTVKNRIIAGFTNTPFINKEAIKKEYSGRQSYLDLVEQSIQHGQNEKGFILCIKERSQNKKEFDLYQLMPQRKAAFHNKNYLIFGKSQLRVPYDKLILESNFGLEGHHFDSRELNVNHLLAEGQKQYQTDLISLEIYQIRFKNQSFLQINKLIQERDASTRKKNIKIELERSKLISTIQEEKSKNIKLNEQFEQLNKKYTQCLQKESKMEQILKSNEVLKLQQQNEQLKLDKRFLKEEFVQRYLNTSRQVLSSSILGTEALQSKNRCTLQNEELKIKLKNCTEILSIKNYELERYEQSILDLKQQIRRIKDQSAINHSAISQSAINHSAISHQPSKFDGLA